MPPCWIGRLFWYCSCNSWLYIKSTARTHRGWSDRQTETYSIFGMLCAHHPQPMWLGQDHKIREFCPKCGEGFSPCHPKPYSDRQTTDIWTSIAAQAANKQQQVKFQGGMGSAIWNKFPNLKYFFMTFLSWCILSFSKQQTAQPTWQQELKLVLNC